MRNTLLATAAVFGLALAMPAFAQTATDQTPANPSSVKDGTPAAGTGSGAAPGNDPATSGKTGATLGAQAPTTDPGPLGAQSNPSAASSSDASGNGTVNSGMGAPAANTGTSGGMPSDASPSTGSTGTPAHPRHHTARASTHGSGDMSSSDDTAGTGHWAHQPGSGMSGPASMKASNISSADTHSAIAPHLPEPKVGAGAGPEGYLRAADRDLAMKKTGAAQQALEMAETRLLDRSTPASDSSQPSQNPRIQAVSAARKALASGDIKGARQSIQEAMNSPQSAGAMGSSSSGAMGGSSSGAMGADAASPAMNPPGSRASSAGGATGSMQNGMSNTTGSVGTGTAGATQAPMDPSGNQAPMSPGAAGAPTPGTAAPGTVTNPTNPAGCSK